MSYRGPLTQYQVKTDPVFTGGETVTADKWIYPWSEPVRYKKIEIALIASGNFFTPASPFPEVVFEDRWHYPWSEPVRQRQGLGPQYQQYNTLDTQQIPTNVGMAWFGWLSEPVREKPGLGAWLQKTIALDVPVQPPAATLIQWFGWLSEPVREKIGLKAELQRAFTGPERLMPPPDITMTMNAVEINNDVFLGAINVYNSVTPVTGGQGAKVSIVEVAAAGGDPVSIWES